MVVLLKSVPSLSIEEVMKWLRNNDKYTVEHSQRVAKITLALGKEIGLPMNVLKNLYQGALLHDVGKIAVAPEILNKPGALTPEEYRHVMSHTVVGYDIVKKVVPKRVAEMIYHHHDHYDGQGLDQEMAGKNIPLGARILKLADAFDAMTSGRPYRAAMSLEEALSEIRRCGGTEFDPALASVFLEMRNNSLKEYRR